MRTVTLAPTVPLVSSDYIRRSKTHSPCLLNSRAVAEIARGILVLLLRGAASLTSRLYVRILERAAERCPPGFSSRFQRNHRYDDLSFSTEYPLTSTRSGTCEDAEQFNIRSRAHERHVHVSMSIRIANNSDQKQQQSMYKLPYPQTK